MKTNTQAEFKELMAHYINEQKENLTQEVAHLYQNDDIKFRGFQTLINDISTGMDYLQSELKNLSIKSFQHEKFLTKKEVHQSKKHGN